MMTFFLEKLLVLTGFPLGASRFTDVVVISSTDDNDFTCTNYPEIPASLAGSIGGTFRDGTGIVCGGIRGEDMHSEDRCYTLGTDQGASARFQ